MKNLTDTPVWTEAVRCVEDNDDVDGANSEAMQQDLANRTAYLKAKVDTEGTRTKRLKLLDGHSTSYGEGSDAYINRLGAGSFTVGFSVADSYWYQPVNAPVGATLTGVVLDVYQIGSGSGGRMKASLYVRDASGADDLAEDVYATEGTGAQTITIDSLEHVVTDDDEIWLEIRGATGIGESPVPDMLTGGVAVFIDPAAGLPR